ncbi:hypothetical protein DVH24_020709 [Malus domestica]|uniref:Trimethylguanosine synthase n=1 Tax=Malus domestica TaxID=3750 RepID=A0A498J960_MALDO|nr:hypothetical protein DVH24_020709 [Malus domestica]
MLALIQRCGASKIDSFQESINEDVSQGEIELTVDTSMSDTALSAVTVSRCLEHSHEINQNNNTCNDGNTSCFLFLCFSSPTLLSLDGAHSFGNKTKQLICDNVCNSVGYHISFSSFRDQCNSVMYLCSYFLINTAKEVATRIIMFLPRNVDINQLAEIALSRSQPWSLEKNFLNGKLKGITVYFSETARR